MDVRPLDHGDEHPSDIGDVAPVSPVAGFSEGPDLSGGIWSRRKPRTRINQEFVPDGKKGEKFLPRRLSFDGIIVSRTTPLRGGRPIIYKVLRQDGRVVNAQAFGKEGFYSDYRVGDSITIQETQKPDVYSVVGEPKSKQLNSIEVSMSDFKVVNIFTFCEFDTVEEQTNTDFDVQIGGVVLNSEEKSVLCYIDFSVSIELMAPVKNGANADQIYSYMDCYDGEKEEVEELTEIKAQGYDKQSGFKLSKWDCSTLLWLSGGNSHFMPYQPEGGGPIKWSGDPRLAGSLILGTKVPQGWLRIHTNGDSLVWLGNGDSRHAYRFPNNPPVMDSYLRVAGISNFGEFGAAIQLEHSEQGASGEVNYTDCLGYCKSFVVRKGIIISGDGLEVTTQVPPVNFVNEFVGEYEPC